jgi:hypothetical protein
VWLKLWEKNKKRGQSAIPCKNRQHIYKREGRFSDLFHHKFERKTSNLTNFTNLRHVVGGRHHLTREITRIKCGNCKEKEVGGRLHTRGKEHKFFN